MSKPSFLHRIYRRFTPGNRYNITGSWEYSYTWFRVAKNGTRSILKILEEETNPEINGDLIKYRKEDHINQFKFAIIRNPWDRVVSAYLNKVVKEKLFKECWGKEFDYFVKTYLRKVNIKTCDKHICSQLELFPFKDLDHLGRFENLANEYDFIAEKIGIDRGLEHKNKSSRRHYSEYYTDETREIVSSLYKDDIAVGKYTFGDG